MDVELSEIIGVLLVIVPMLVWTLNAFGLNVVVPEYHFTTLIWAGVSLILGYNAKQALKKGGTMLDNGNNNGKG